MRKVTAAAAAAAVRSSHKALMTEDSHCSLKPSEAQQRLLGSKLCFLIWQHRAIRKLELRLRAAAEEGPATAAKLSLRALGRGRRQPLSLPALRVDHRPHISSLPLHPRNSERRRLHRRRAAAAVEKSLRVLR